MIAGWALVCPVCQIPILPAGGLLHLAVAPRFAWHLWDAHPYETRILLLHLAQPPVEWPVVDSITEPADWDARQEQAV